MIQNRLNKLLVLTLLFVLTQINITNAQRVRANVGLGLAAYYGDLTNANSPTFKPAFSVGASYDVSEQFKIRLHLSQLSFSGDDKKSTRIDIKERNLNFKTNVTEIGLLGEYDILNSGDQAIIPYIFGGPGVYFFNPKAIDTDIALQPLGTEGQNLPSGRYADRKYSTTQINLQLGAGVRYEVSETVGIGFEFSFRKLFTDYLDDVSNNKGYIDPSEFIAANQLDALNYNYRDVTKPNSYLPRGNPNRNDTYYSFQIRATFRLDGINLGGSTDFYGGGGGGNYRARGSLRNPKRLF